MRFAYVGLVLFLAATSWSAAIDFQRDDYVSPMTLGSRKRVAERAALYPEVQYKYALFQNYLGIYIDRPLFFDRSLRPEQFTYLTAESYFRDLAIMRRYGFTGSGSLALGIINLYKRVNGFLEADPARAAGHQEYVQFAFGEMGRFSADDKKLQQAREILNIAQKSPYAGRMNGKLLITTYNSAYIPQDTMREFLGALRAEFGDIFLISGGLVVDHVDNRHYREHGSWPEEIQAKYRSKLIDVLTLFDGVQLPVGTRQRGTEYTTYIDYGIYEKYILPMALELAAEERFAGKLLGAVLTHGYINHMSGVNHGEYGTASLRKSLDQLLKVNPDFIVFFEWNEFNENTCFQPTLTNSLALQRLIKYYSLAINGGEPAPEPGDDVQTPPLILSHRETLKVGEVLDFELLNVPDSREQQTYTARLRLLDAAGTPVVEFPQETFDRSQLRAVTYRVATEELTPGVVFLPELTVTRFDGRQEVYANLQYVRLMPTFCYNYKATRQPLRDLLRPEQVQFTAVRQADGSDALTATITATEPLAAVEVTDYGRDFYAVDPSQEFDREKNWLLIGSLTTRKSGNHQIELRVPGSENWQFHPWWRPNIKFGDWKRKDGVLTCKTLIWGAPNDFIVSIPRTDVSAEICFKVAGEERRMKLADFLAVGAWAWQYSTCRLTWRLCQEQPDTPPCPDALQSSLAVTLTSARRYPIYQLRAVTRSGRIYRSRPILPVALPEATRTIAIHSELRDQVLSVPVCAALLPELRYTIRPPESGGATMTTDFDPFFNAQLGGGYVYSEAFDSIPLPEGRQVPEYIIEDGKPALRFDGGSYATMPKESFPRGSFTLEFEIKPDPGQETYVLFRHFARILGSVTLYVENDELKLAFGERDYIATHRFPSGLRIERGQWSRVTVSYDLASFRFQVGDRVNTAPTPQRLLALYFKPGIFGGHTKVEFGLPTGARYYSGLMRDLIIRHW